VRKSRQTATVLLELFVAGFIVVAVATPARTAQPSNSTALGSDGTFDRASWVADYGALRLELQRTYSNLAWFASPAGGRDLPAVNRQTLAALMLVTDDRSARLAVEAFVASFGDPHFSVLPNFTKAPAPTAPPVAPPFRGVGARTACAALGFTRSLGSAFSAPFDALPGFRLENDGSEQAYRSGTYTTPSRIKIGIVRLPNFFEEQNPPECESAWADAQKDSDPAALCDDSCADNLWDRVDVILLNELRERLRTLRNAGATAVVVDLGDNPGGHELGDWVPRLFTASPVYSARMGLVRDPASAAYYDEQLGQLQATLKTPLSSSDRLAVDSAIAVYQSHRNEVVAGPACPMAWVWTEQRPWKPFGDAHHCSNLVFGNTFESGERAYLPQNAVTSPIAASAIYSAAVANPMIGAWQGPVYVVVDRKSFSGGELAAARFQDNAIGKIVGDVTGGAGCGFDYNSSYTLPSGRMRFRIPNCVRLRKDGTNEAAGLRPDLYVPLYLGETSAQHAERLLNAIISDLAKG
jgi:hypothetical protein